MSDIMEKGAQIQDDNHHARIQKLKVRDEHFNKLKAHDGNEAAHALLDFFQAEFESDRQFELKFDGCDNKVKRAEMHQVISKTFNNLLESQSGHYFFKIKHNKQNSQKSKRGFFC